MIIRDKKEIAGLYAALVVPDRFRVAGIIRERMPEVYGSVVARDIFGKRGKV